MAHSRSQPYSSSNTLYCVTLREYSPTVHKLCQNPFRLVLWTFCLSEKQIPQVFVFIRSRQNEESV